MQTTLDLVGEALSDEGTAQGNCGVGAFEGGESPTPGGWRRQVDTG